MSQADSAEAELQVQRKITDPFFCDIGHHLKVIVGIIFFTYLCNILIVDMKNVKCWKDSLWYSTSLEIYREMNKFLVYCYFGRFSLFQEVLYHVIGSFHLHSRQFKFQFIHILIQSVRLQLQKQLNRFLNMYLKWHLNSLLIFVGKIQVKFR